MMPKTTLESELKVLQLAFDTNVASRHNPLADNVKKDLDQALDCRIRGKPMKFLIWGLLIGRGVDSFTVFFLSAKNEPPQNTFDGRIRRICRTQNPLTTDLTIKSDLDNVRRLRNDLFHNAGRHFNDREMETFVFKSTRCIQQLIRDL